MLIAATTSQKVNVVVVVLATLGFVVLGASIWFWRATRPDPEALGPLEVMSDGSWRDANFTDRRNRLEAARSATSEVAASYAASRVHREGLSELAARHEGEQPAFDENAGFGDLLDARIGEHSPMSPEQLSAAVAAGAGGVGAAGVGGAGVGGAGGAAAGRTASADAAAWGDAVVVAVGDAAASAVIVTADADSVAVVKQDSIVDDELEVDEEFVADQDSTADDGIPRIPGDPLTVVRET